MWVKLDDGFFDHPKVMAAGPRATTLYIAGLAYAARYLTNGFIPERQADLLVAKAGAKRADIDVLVRVELWHPAEDGYQIHDWADYNPSAEKVKQQQRQNAERQAAFRERQVRDPQGRYRSDSPSVSNSVTTTVSHTSPVPVPVPVPVPDQQELTAPPTPPPPSAPSERQRLVREWCALTGARRLNPAQEAKLYAVATTTAERGEPGTLTEMMRYAAEHATASPWAFFLRLVEAYDRGDPWRRPALTVVPGGGKPKRQAHDDLARDLTEAEWDEELLKARAINKNIALPPHLEAVWQARQQQRAVS